MWGESLLPMLFYDLITALTYPAATLAPPSRVHAMMSSRPLRALAQISLAVYVIHEALIRSLPVAVYGPLPGLQSADPAAGDIHMPVWGAAVTLPLSLALGWLLTHYYERPMSRWILRRAIGPERDPSTSRATGDRTVTAPATPLQPVALPAEC